MARHRFKGYRQTLRSAERHLRRREEWLAANRSDGYAKAELSALRLVLGLLTDCLAEIPKGPPVAPRKGKLRTQIATLTAERDALAARLAALHGRHCTPEDCRLDGGPEHAAAFPGADPRPAAAGGDRRPGGP
jgi:hypothetical protein